MGCQKPGRLADKAGTFREESLLHLAGSQPMLKSSYKEKDCVIISIPPLVGGMADVVVEIKGTEFVSKNSNDDIESFSPSPIPVEDSDFFMEEIDLTLTPDDLMPSSIEEDDDDSEKHILIHKELLDNYSPSLPVNESFHFDIPSFSRPPAKPPDGNTRILNIKMMGDISDQKCGTCENLGTINLSVRTSVDYFMGASHSMIPMSWGVGWSGENGGKWDCGVWWGKLVT
nr:hypothetical protein [Tanacetum cinerariifolium]